MLYEGKRSCENCGNVKCLTSAVAFLWDMCVDSNFEKHWRPRVTERCLARAEHAIGMDNRKTYKRKGKEFYKPYRNYYETVVDDIEWQILEWYGLAMHGKVREDGDYKGLCHYHMTLKGMEWMEKVLKITIKNKEEYSYGNGEV